MAGKPSFLQRFRLGPTAFRRLAATGLVLALVSGGAVYAANNSVQGGKKEVSFASSLLVPKDRTVGST